MPTYDYLCNDCEHRFEEFQSITAKAIEICPKCKGSVRRLIGLGNGFIFKGSGFYITDYKKSNSISGSSSSEKKESKAGSKSEKKSSEKSDTKTT
ncbi:MAG: FmdB family zinc ribbon protein [bacterium]